MGGLGVRRRALHLCEFQEGVGACALRVEGGVSGLLYKILGLRRG